MTPADYADPSAAEGVTELLTAQTVMGDLGARGVKAPDESIEEKNCLLITRQDARPALSNQAK